MCFFSQLFFFSLSHITDDRRLKKIIPHGYYPPEEKQQHGHADENEYYQPPSRVKRLAAPHAGFFIHLVFHVAPAMGTDLLDLHVTPGVNRGQPFRLTFIAE